MLKSADVLKGWKGVLVNVYVDFQCKKCKYLICINYFSTFATEFNTIFKKLFYSINQTAETFQ